MATRALVGFINDKPELISTYNHYDGYPENLGKGLESHYSMPEEALKVASMGYISYMDPQTGEIEAKHKEPADRTPLSTNFDEAMMQVAEMGDSYGADYIYIYNVENSDWAHASVGRGIRGAAEQLRRVLIDLDGGIFGPSLDEVNEDYNTKWNKFLNEVNMDNEVVMDTSSAIRDAEKALELEHAPYVEIYLKSLANDIRLNGDKSYEGFGEEDWQEDFQNFIYDKMEALD
jgi:hypothetical protein